MNGASCEDEMKGVAQAGIVKSCDGAAKAGDGVEGGEGGLKRGSRQVGVQKKVEVRIMGRGVGGGGEQDSQNVDGQKRRAVGGMRPK
jgi:hypothetical protein